MNDIPENSSPAGLRGRRTAALVLLLVAGLALGGKYLPFAWRDSLLLLLGLAFIGWAAFDRVAGLLVPGGILTGVGVGILLRPEHGNAVFLFAMAGGFALIPVLSLLIFQRRMGWPFFPAAGLVLAGLTQLAGSAVQRWLHDIGPLWPYGLIVIALYLLLTKPHGTK